MSHHMMPANYTPEPFLKPSSEKTEEERRKDNLTTYRKGIAADARVLRSLPAWQSEARCDNTRCFMKSTGLSPIDEDAKQLYRVLMKIELRATKRIRAS